MSGPQNERELRPSARLRSWPVLPEQSRPLGSPQRRAFDSPGARGGGGSAGLDFPTNSFRKVRRENEGFFETRPVFRNVERSLKTRDLAGKPSRNAERRTIRIDRRVRLRSVGIDPEKETRSLGGTKKTAALCRATVLRDTGEKAWVLALPLASCYFLSHFRRYPANPTRPVPMSSMLAGSGTGRETRKSCSPAKSVT